MQSAVLLGQFLNAVAGRVHAAGDAPMGATWQRSLLASGRATHAAEHTVLGGADWRALVMATLLALLAVGGAASVARRLQRRSAPELMVLLDQSAAFYGRWPEDRLANAPRAEMVAEAVRCRRIIVLLERRTASGDARGPAEAGPVEALRAWIALLSSRLDGRLDPTSGTAYA
ncbi:MAG: hypothetical protein ABW001_05385 [Mycobacterium sp.]